MTDLLTRENVGVAGGSRSSGASDRGQRNVAVSAAAAASVCLCHRWKLRGNTSEVGEGVGARALPKRASLPWFGDEPPSGHPSDERWATCTHVEAARPQLLGKVLQMLLQKICSFQEAASILGRSL